jgi:octaprenyl-diphosphate synthase
MDQQTIRALCAADMTAVNELILARLQSDVSLINQLGFYIVSAGGKRMRPMLTVMAARALGYEGEDHLKLAAIIEFIHTSTLLHDDVVDESDLRAAKPPTPCLATPPASWWATTSQPLLPDDGELSATCGDGGALGCHQYHRRRRSAAADELQRSGYHGRGYMMVIYCKTAKLFEASDRLAAMLTHRPSPSSRP